MKRFALYVLPALLYAALIFFLSAQSSLPGPRIVGFDKVEHLGAYAVLGLLIARALMAYGVARRKAAVLALVLGFLYGVSDEYHQSFVPGRTADWRDAMADLLGSSIGAGVYALGVMRRREPAA